METQHLPEQATPGFYEFPLDHEESFSVRLLYDRWASFYHKNEHVGFNLFKIDEKKCSKDWQVKGFKSNEVFIVFKKIKQKKKGYTISITLIILCILLSRVISLGLSLLSN